MKRILLFGFVTGVLFCSVFALSSFSTQSKKTARSQPVETAKPPVKIMILKDSILPADPADAQRIVSGTPLDPKDKALLLKRAPKFESTKPLLNASVFPAGPKPDERPGTEVDIPFPPSETAGDSIRPSMLLPTEPVQIEQYSPEGRVDKVNQVTMTFSQPMILLQALEKMSKPPVVRLYPQPEGQWRWLGVQTLAFESLTPFPGSNKFHVGISDGMKSIFGNSLTPFQFEFQTPSLKLQATFHSVGKTELTPVLAMVFNQEIQKEAILYNLRVSDMRTTQGVQLVSEEEILQTPGAKAFSERFSSKRSVVFKPNQELPKDASIRITLPPGSYSAEGPLPSENALEFEFKTYAPFKLLRAKCGYRDECRPTDAWTFQFNNILDAEACDLDSIAISPTIEHRDIRIYHDLLIIQGLRKENQDYQVTLPGTLADMYGQTLVKPHTSKFKTGNFDQFFSAAWEQRLITLPKTSPATLFIHSQSIHAFKVRIQQVNSKDYAAYLELQKTSRTPNFNLESVSLPGEEIVSKLIPVESGSSALDLTKIELEPLLKSRHGYGQFIVAVIPQDLEKRVWHQHILSWVQVSDLGVYLTEDRDRMVFQSYQVSTGKPRSGVQIQSLNLNIPFDVETSGSLQLQKNKDPIYRTEEIWYARNQDDELIFSIPSRERGVNDHAIWYATTDRGIYKPGESVSLKGMVRWQEESPQGDLQFGPFAGKKLDWKCLDARRNELAKGSTSINKMGSFNLSLEIPNAVELGPATLLLQTPDPNKDANPSSTLKYHYSFQIQEFRVPEYEVQTQVLKEGPYLQGQDTAFQVKASYYAGGGLAEAVAQWSFKALQARYQPPGWDKFSFGIEQPWWRCWPSQDLEEAIERTSGVTDFEGQHVVTVQLTDSDQPRPFTLTGEATVTDVNNQAWSSRKSILVHPSRYYVGVQLDSRFHAENQTCSGSLIVTDIDGKPIENLSIVMSLVPSSGNWDSSDQDQPPVVFSQTLKSQKDPLPFSFNPQKTGSFEFILEIRDGENRVNLTKVPIWFFGKKSSDFWDPDAEELTLIPEKNLFAPGETAQILVQAPFQTGWGTMSVCRSGLLDSVPFDLENGMARVSFPIKDSHVPNLFFEFHVQETGSTGLPKASSGSLDLKVSALKRNLELRLEPMDPFMQPAGESSVELEILQANGDPAADTEVLIMMVDEAVLALDGFQLADPLSVFYPERGSLTRFFDTSQNIFLETQPAVGGLGSGAEMDQEGVVYSMAEAMPPPSAAPGERVRSMAPKRAKNGGDEGPKPISARSDFASRVFFAPEVKTDRLGRAVVKFKLKDNLTRYRIMALAIGGAKNFGTGSANVTARLPLMVRPSAPRFLNLGDRFLLPITLQNQTDQDMDINILIQGNNLMFANEWSAIDQDFNLHLLAKQAVIPANDRIVMEFPTRPDSTGTAGFQVVAASRNPEQGGEDAAVISLPVLVPASTEAFATYGEIQDDGAHTYDIKKPEDVFPTLGGLELQMSSTQLQTLTDAYIYIRNYPFECSEQLATKLITVVILRDLIQNFQPEVDDQNVQQFLEDLTTRLSQNQLPNGGFSFWTDSGREWPFLTLHATHALVRADQAGLAVRPEVLKKALEAVTQIERAFPDYLSPSGRASIKAYSYYVLALAGQNVSSPASLLYKNQTKDLSRESLAWLCSALSMCQSKDLASQILLKLKNQVIQTTSTAELDTHQSGDTFSLFWSQARDQALFLEALLSLEPENGLATKLVRGMLGHRVNGRWNNTQENLWSLIAMQKFLHVREKTTPDFSVKSWLNDGFAGQYQFSGRDGKWVHLDIPMDALQQEDNFLIWKEGPGRLYYRLGLDYTPLSLDLPPIEQGFSIVRTYEAIENPSDVSQDNGGNWHIRAGAKVRIKIKFSQISTRQHVALVDHLPAGFEAINPALKVSSQDEGAPSSKNRPAFWWNWTWYQHQNLRTDRAEAFATRVSAGSREYSYMARATTRGAYIAPPAKIEEMYQPETFARTSTDQIFIE